MCEALVKGGADANRCDPSTGNTPLHVLCAARRAKKGSDALALVARLLEDGGADLAATTGPVAVSDPGRNGGGVSFVAGPVGLRTALHEAVDAGNVEVVRLLLDDSQSRVASALQRVRDIKDIKDCVGGLQHAIASLGFEVAVPHLHRFHSIKDAMPSDSTDFLQMERLEGELKDKMTHALDRAAADAATGDAAEVLRCCRLFGELENAEAGLWSYTAFVRGGGGRWPGRRPPRRRGRRAPSSTGLRCSHG